jgi:hypothetical protein
MGIKSVLALCAPRARCVEKSPIGVAQKDSVIIF